MILNIVFSESNQCFTPKFGEVNYVSDGGYDVGYEDGRKEGYDEGYPIGYDKGVTYGTEVGYATGYGNGHSVGVEEGYGNGYSVGSTEGYSTGYTKGHSDGVEAGYADGFEDGVESVSGEEWYITDASYLFSDGARLDIKDTLLSRLKDVTDIRNMFTNCTTLSEVDVSNWDTSKVTNMVNAFSGCHVLEELDVSNWDTRNVTNMSNMFSNCQKVKNLDISKFDTSNVTNISYMFNGCKEITHLDFSNWDTGNIKTISGLFANCTALEEIVGFSATNKAGFTIRFPDTSSTSTRYRLRRLTFRTDLPDGVYSIRSAILVRRCSFDRDGMVEMFNTLPDVSGLGLSSSDTTITITGNPCVSDTVTLLGSDYINVDSMKLTAEDEAIAASKGWTLVK